MDEKYTILKYDPSVPGNIVIGVLYAIESLVLFCYITRHKDKWALCLPLGAIASSIGFFVRIGLDPHDVSLILYIVQSMFIVASPSAFLAFNYMLYGRFIAAIDPRFGSDKSQSKMEKSRYSFIPPRIVGRIFIWSDITTFLIQISAGGMLGGGGDNLSLVKTGDTLFLVGVCAQGVCYFLFTALLSVTLMRLVAERQTAGLNRSGRSCMGLDKNTLIIASGLYFSSLCISIRSIYRIIEFSQGHNGYLVSNEVFLFVLDAVPLVLAIGIWAIVWPTAALDKIAAQVRDGAQTYYMESGISQLRLSSIDSSARN
ncbi:hypothetical protein BG011_001416 [Mortierella polycephala]|uniref:Uncharacterized protein n=1 Tax=Mortierella polycephala TaxID=41804 RepID=A0A9P6PKW3_9FUNG|nr:hypothetical protein BG011_001416 [Mortierella polycephala]